MSACSSNEALNTGSLKVEKEGINTNYEPIGKNIAEKALPYKMKYPSYFPFKSEETKVAITGWENSKEKIVSTIKFPSIEEDEEWKENSIIQPSIPHVEYTVANFNRYYDKYLEEDQFEKVQIKDNLKGLYKVNRKMNGAELHWFTDGIEYNLHLRYFSHDSEKLKTELLKIAKSI